MQMILTILSLQVAPSPFATEIDFLETSLPLAENLLITLPNFTWGRLFLSHALIEADYFLENLPQPRLLPLDP